MCFNDVGGPMGKTLRFDPKGKSQPVSPETLRRERLARKAKGFIFAQAMANRMLLALPPLVESLDLSREDVLGYRETKLRGKFEDDDELFDFLVETIIKVQEGHWEADPLHYLAVAEEFKFQEHRNQTRQD